MYVKCSYSPTRALCSLQWVITGIQLSAVLYSLSLRASSGVWCIQLRRLCQCTLRRQRGGKGLDEHGLVYLNLLPGNTSDWLPGLTSRQTRKRRVTKSLLSYLGPGPRLCVPKPCRVLALLRWAGAQVAGDGWLGRRGGGVGPGRDGVPAHVHRSGPARAGAEHERGRAVCRVWRPAGDGAHRNAGARCHPKLHPDM